MRYLALFSFARPQALMDMAPDGPLGEWGGGGGGMGKVACALHAETDQSDMHQY